LNQVKHSFRLGNTTCRQHGPNKPRPGGYIACQTEKATGVKTRRDGRRENACKKSQKIVRRCGAWMATCKHCDPARLQPWSKTSRKKERGEESLITGARARVGGGDELAEVLMY